jgi:hypothetical protein
MLHEYSTPILNKHIGYTFNIYRTGTDAGKPQMFNTGPQKVKLIGVWIK